ncbi:MAG: helix-turn-helix domain-containing protein [Candidatus Eremiobacteraeota bacterium]|nr:helix-turn-helix domain-containing protein [Candidatus Eremiobacteraeota bacterium]
MRPNAWTDEDDAKLRAAYAPNGGGISAAHRALPDRTPAAIGFRVWLLGLARRKGPKDEPRVPQSKGSPRPAQRTSIPVNVGSVVAPKPKPVDPGPCTRGDREHIRRRIGFVIADLARELGRSPGSVRRAILSLAENGFERDAIGMIHTDPEEIAGATLGQSTFVSRPVPDRRRGRGETN